MHSPPMPSLFRQHRIDHHVSVGDAISPNPSKQYFAPTIPDDKHIPYDTQHIRKHLAKKREKDLRFEHGTRRPHLVYIRPGRVLI